MAERRKLTEFYKMPVFATLAVRDLSLAASWYREVLGFKIILRIRRTTETPGLIHLRRARYQDLLLVPRFQAYLPESRDPGGGSRFTLRVEGDLDQVTERALAAGARIVDGPADKPWKAREVTFQDLDGYHITLSDIRWIPGIA